jgi:hypothetical protein
MCARSSCVRLCLQPDFNTTGEVRQSLDAACLAEGGWNRGRRLDRAAAAGSKQAIVWPLLDQHGRRLTAGAYYATFSTPGVYRVAEFAVVAP